MKTYGSINLRRNGKILLRIAIGLLAAVAVYTLIDIVTAFIKYDICELYVYEKYKENGYDYPSIRLQDPERMAETSEIHMTREEMLEDIDYYFELIGTCQPNLPYYEQIYGFDWDDMHLKCRSEAAELDSPEEFYGYISSVVNMFPSSHSAVLAPRYETLEYAGTSYLNAIKTLNDDDMIGYMNGWEKRISDYASENGFFAYDIGLQYLPQDYYITTANEKFSELVGSRVISINGENTVENITKYLCGSKLEYDFLNGKSYYFSVYLYGEPTDTSREILLLLQTPEGENKELTMYMDCVRTMLSFAAADTTETVSEKDSGKSAVSGTYYYNDDENLISYIRLSYLTASSREQINALDSLEYDDLIVDLRY